MIDILNHSEVDNVIQLALAEDGIQNDLTTLCTGVDDQFQTRATIVAKKETIASGSSLIAKILKAADTKVRCSVLSQDGTLLKSGSPWIILEGPAGELLRTERVILNFLIRMCGIAHYTSKVVQAVSETSCKVLHTRKTAPGLRRIDIYACLSGGAHLHRRSLDDAILVKENHIHVAHSFQSLGDGIKKYKSQARFVEIEVRDFVELKYAVGLKPDRIMLDNFSIPDIEKAVHIFSSSVELEASGNIDLNNAAVYANTGVDYISLGSLTHSAKAADLSMLFDFKK